ncbi:MAG: sulfotransferase domain-containing protein [Crocosphaera sp.]|nr:sulfotransferase domain-containing protein [Crocosphaera sp.]
MKIKIPLKSQQNLVLNLPSPSDYPAFFVFSLHKTGSVLLNQIIIDISNYLGIPIIDIPSSAFSQGISSDQWINETQLCKNIQDGYCYIGFRAMPLFMKDLTLLKLRKKILLVRDPRDILVSHFFSVASSHILPKYGNAREMLLSSRQEALRLTIDEYVIDKASIFLRNWNNYHRYLTFNQDLKLFRYEDVIFNKEQWIIDILSFLELNIPEKNIKTLASKYDIIPTKEDPNSHIRKVAPGDHKEKLKTTTIEILNNLFSEILTQYNYLQ